MWFSLLFACGGPPARRPPPPAATTPTTTPSVPSTPPTSTPTPPPTAPTPPDSAGLPKGITWTGSTGPLAAGDLDADGADELLVGGDGAAWIVDGTPASGALDDVARARIEVSGTPGDFAKVVSVTGDVTGDGLADIAVESPEDGAWILAGDAAGVDPSVEATLGLTYWTRLATVIPGDFNGDGQGDVATVGALLYGPLAGDLPSTAGFFYFYSPPLLALDWDGDGIDELLFGSEASDGFGGGALSLDASGGETLAWQPDWHMHTAASTSAILCGDVDADGLPDFAAVTWVYGGLATYPPPDLAVVTHTDATALGDAAIRFEDPFSLGNVRCGDLDGDGATDVAVAEETSGGPGVGVVWGPVPPGVLDANAVARWWTGTLGLAADLDGDGADELVLYDAGLLVVDGTSL